MAAITAELALEISKFQASLKQAQDHLRSFKAKTESTGAGLGSSLTSGLNEAVGGIGPMLVTGITAAATAAGVTLAALGLGLKNAFDLGGHLTDAATRMGTTAGKAQVLETALANAGMEGETAATVVQKLQDAIASAQSDPEKLKTFRSLGLDPAAMLTMDSVDAFEQVGAAIAGIENPMLRTQAAMDLFGRKGTEMLALFGDAGAMAFAREQLGDQSRILDDSASDFDRASDILGGAFKKVQGFFVGLGSRLVEHLMPAFDAFNQLDLAGIGQRFGDAIMSAVQWVRAVWQTIDFAMAGQLVKDGLIIAIKESVNVLYAGLVASFFAAVQMLVEDVKNVIAMFSILTTGDFWMGLGNVLLGIARTFGAAMLEFIAQAITNLKDIPGATSILGDSDQLLKDIAREARSMANNNFNSGTDQLSPAMEAAQKRMAETLTNVGQRFAQNFQKAARVFETDDEKSRFSDAAKRISAQAQANAQAVSKPEGTKTAITPKTVPMDDASKARATPGLFASAINLIMGRSANELILDESKKQTAKLDAIDKKLGDMNRKLDKPAAPRAVTAAPVMPFDMIARFA